MQEHARLANVHPPQLHTHDRFGRRIDQVEFHPSYHALLGSALAHRPARHAVDRAGRVAHVERAAGFMLFTELEPSILCPVSMSYAVTPALRGNAALFADWRPEAGADRATTRASCPSAHKTGVTMGMGMTEKQGGSDVRANTTRAVPDGDDAWGERYRDHRPQVVLLGADVRRLPGAGAGAGRPELLLPAARAARRHASTRSASSA